MSSATRQALPGARWFLQHGPINCIAFAQGDAQAVADAHEAAWQRFASVLDELVAERPLLGLDLSATHTLRVQPQGVIAQRMFAACRGPGSEFITAMAAVAGAVAQELVACYAGPGIARAYVNNGGDIALWLGPGAAFEVGLVSGLQTQPFARVVVDAQSGVRGIATSGWRGRSFSLGIADAVTVLAATAAQADAAATLIANAVNLDDPRIQRRAAQDLRDDTDLGARRVTVAVPPLSAAQIALALGHGLRRAEAAAAAGQIHAAALSLQGQVRVCTASSAPALALKIEHALPRDCHAA